MIRPAIITLALLFAGTALGGSAVIIDTGQSDAVIDTALPDVKISSLWKQLNFHAPLTPNYLQTAVLASDVSSAGNHAVTDNGTATYSATGYDCDGSTDSQEFPATDIFNTASVTIAFRFTPDDAADADSDQLLMDTSTGSRYFVRKENDASSNVLEIRLGDTALGLVPLATYQGEWVVGTETTLIVSGTTGNNNAWMGSTQIMTADATAWTAKNPALLHVCSALNDSLNFNGRIRDLRIWPRVLTAAERAAYIAADIGS